MKTYVLDTECYKDYFLLMIKDLETGEIFWGEQYSGCSSLFTLPEGRFVTFNGLHFDFPLLSVAFRGADTQLLKTVCDEIILYGALPWNVVKKYRGVDLSHIDHIDLINVSPGQVGLKTYGGRIHSKRLQDLPIAPDAGISPEDRETLRKYCANDLQTTQDLWNYLQPQIKLRESMSNEYGLDLRSKSDAQIAEAVIKRKLEVILNRKLSRYPIDPSYRFRYKVPEFIGFTSVDLQSMLDVVRNAWMGLDGKGSVKIPKELESMRVRIGRGVYRLGVGGLHSSETSVGYNRTLIDRDVTSYYPSIILNLGLYPHQLGPEFLDVYRDIVERRVAAKRSGDKITAESLKVCVNGSFGKLGNKWSVLYSPSLMIQVTLTGQLSLLMLIEMIEIAGISVVSANTDGVVIDCPGCRTEELNNIIRAWEIITGFNTEETIYKALYQKDVNNYIAIKPDGKAKLKGLYAVGGLQKNPTNSICVEAVIAHLSDGVPVEQTICGCGDVKKFCTIRQVKGGALYDVAYLGKTVRWYYAAGEERHIEYATNGNKVARSDGARPIMELPETIPVDLDYMWYIEEARSILSDVGA